ncbi:hypothetical protein F4811DRAFT_571452 [Daldinia bambusicola]|nr:hypothetical protein F4811DRAFT_571452 [Daldinia bambusicola]
MSAPTNEGLSSSGPTRGPRQSQQPVHWSEIEENILKEAVARYGVSHWEDVAKMIWTGKTAEDCRAHWAELVPVLYEGLVRRESAREQRRTRSITVSAVGSARSTSRQGDKTSQATRPAPSRPAPASTPMLPSGPASASAQERQGTAGDMASNQADGNIAGITHPAASLVPLPPTGESPLSPLGSASARIRRNTEPARPFHATPASRGKRTGEREWLAPHPLMPGRRRNTPASSRDSSAPRKKDDKNR